MFNYNRAQKSQLLKNQKGQTFLEFILVLLMLITIAWTFMTGFNHYIGARWEVMLKIIARPNGNNISL